MDGVVVDVRLSAGDSALADPGEMDGHQAGGSPVSTASNPGKRPLLARILSARKIWLPLAVSLLFIGWLVSPSGVKLERVWEAIQSANYWLLAPAVALHCAGLWVRAVRWHSLLKPQQKIAINELFTVSVIGFFVNGVLPMRLGEFVRSQLLASRNGLKTTAVLATVVAERVADGLTLLAMFGIASLTVPLDAAMEGIFRGSGVVFLSILLIASLVALTGGVERWLPVYLNLVVRLPSGLVQRAAVLAGSFASGLTGMSRPGVLIPVALTSAAAWFIEAVVYGLVLVAFGVVQPISIWLLMTSAANLGTAVPSSQGGFGPFEFFGARTLELAGVDPSIAIAATVSAHATVLIPIVVLGAFLTYRIGLSFGDLKFVRGPRPEPQTARS